MWRKRFFLENVKKDCAGGDPPLRTRWLFRRYSLSIGFAAVKRVLALLCTIAAVSRAGREKLTGFFCRHIEWKRLMKRKESKQVRRKSLTEYKSRAHCFNHFVALMHMERYWGKLVSCYEHTRWES